MPTSADETGGRMRRLLTLIDERFHAPRLRTTAFLVLFGASLACVSVILGVAKLALPCEVLPAPTSVACTLASPRQIGWLAAPNWSLTTLALWPAMFYALRSLLKAADTVFADLDSSPMAWLAEQEPDPKPTIAATWNRQKCYLRRAAVAIAVAGIAFSLSEWWRASGAPLLFGTRPEEGEFDWSAIRLAGGFLGNLPHAAFTLAAFLYQGLAIALMGTFAVTIVLIARTMGLHGSADARPPILVDIESNDPSRRGGFERFVVVIDYMIVFVFLAFVNFFLTRVQNAYLRNYEHGSIGEFIQKDFVVLKFEDIDRLFEIGSADFSSVAVAIGVVLALFQCFFFFNATLRHAALQARTRADHALVRPPLSEKAKDTGLDGDAVRQRLREMNVWPLGYSDLMPTLSFLTICGLTIVFYRIGIYLVFLWIAGWIAARAAAGLLRRS